MKKDNKSLVIIGFKHVGKTVIGHALSNRLNLPFIDLDRCIESAFKTQYHQEQTCRQIMRQKGEVFFRALEAEALEAVTKQGPAVIALGGGAVMVPQNRALIASHTILHVTAPKGLVFERIMLRGRPPFFPAEENPFDAFMRLWNKRAAVYESLADHVVHNDASVTEAVEKIIAMLAERSS